jgi:hypothetical protein
MRVGPFYPFGNPKITFRLRENIPQEQKFPIFMAFCDTAQAAPIQSRLM